MNQLLDGGRRVLGLILLALVAVPAFMVLDPNAEPTTLPDLMRRGGFEHWNYTWGRTGGVWTLAVLAGALLVGLLARGRVSAALAAVGRAIERPPVWVFAALAGAVGAGLTAWVSQSVYDGRTILNDASVQLIQARYFAAGHLAGPPLIAPEFWSIQFMVHTAAGWVSQYPPMHAFLLSLGFRVGAAWFAMVGLMGMLGVFATLAFERLLPDRVSLARLAALFAVASPFLLSLAGAYMNHATVAAFAALALYLALRAEAGSALWAIGAGAAMGAMVTTRPVSGLLIGATVTAGIWLTAPLPEETPKRPWLVRRLGWWVLGGLPFALGLGWFNARFFGSPLTLGYTAASGPNHGLGFHPDPWGRMYSATEALGYTSTELLSLSRELFGTALPVVAFVAVFLLVARRLTRGERILAAWAMLPILGSALYWHHDLLFGPRMLGGAAPAWVALFLLAIYGLVRTLKRGWASDAILVVVFAGLGYGAAVGGPDRVTRLGARVVPVPQLPVSERALVFVHEPWLDRLGARLAGGRNMRLDSVRAFLTQVAPCELQNALAPAAWEDERMQCMFESQSDTLRWNGLTDFIWLDDMPGLGGDGTLWTRDLGPADNADIIQLFPHRTPLIVVPDRRGGGTVVPYHVGMQTLWGGWLDAAAIADSISSAAAADSLAAVESG